MAHFEQESGQLGRQEVIAVSRITGWRNGQYLNRTFIQDTDNCSYTAQDSNPNQGIDAA